MTSDGRPRWSRTGPRSSGPSENETISFLEGRDLPKTRRSRFVKLGPSENETSSLREAPELPKATLSFLEAPVLPEARRSRFAKLQTVRTRDALAELGPSENETTSFREAPDLSRTRSPRCVEGSTLGDPKSSASAPSRTEAISRSAQDLRDVEVPYRRTFGARCALVSADEWPRPHVVERVGHGGDRGAACGGAMRPQKPVRCARDPTNGSHTAT